MERIRFGIFESLRMWLTVARFSCCLLRAGGLRGTAWGVSKTWGRPLACPGLIDLAEA